MVKGVKIGTVPLHQRVQRVKTEMAGIMHNASPGQVEVPLDCWERITEVVEDLEEAIYEAQCG